MFNAPILKLVILSWFASCHHSVHAITDRGCEPLDDGSVSRSELVHNGTYRCVWSDIYNGTLSETVSQVIDKDTISTTERNITADIWAQGDQPADFFNYTRTITEPVGSNITMWIQVPTGRTTPDGMRQGAIYTVIANAALPLRAGCWAVTIIAITSLLTLIW